MMNKEDLAIGIDLGTTFCCMGVYIEGKGVQIIPNKSNDTTFPSIVSFSDSGILACDQAINSIIKEPKNTIYGIKRLIGLSFKDQSVQEDIKLWPFTIVKSDENNSPMVQVTRNNNIEKYYPEEISAIILKRLKSIAEEYLEQNVKYAVITVPAYFTDNQRESTKNAGKLAGLEVLRIINEPTSAALGYGLDKKYGKLSQSSVITNFLKLEEEKKEESETVMDEKEDYGTKNILVFDLGGGTFDVSLVNMENYEQKKIEVLNTSGNTHLGGEDFDHKLVEYCLLQFCSKYKINENDIKNNEKGIKGLKRLKIACEKSKRLLSYTEEIIIDVDNFFNEETLNVKVTRAKFEDLCRDLFSKLIKPIEEVMEQAKIGISDIREVVLVGGSTRIPKIKEIIKDYFLEIKINDSINPDEAVAYGAAVNAYKIHSNNKTALNDIVLLDTTPFSLGLGVGDNYQLIIPKGSTIPTTVTNMGITDYDYQYSVELPIYEGEYNNINKNHFLGQFEISGIPQKPAGEVIFDVIYQVDVDGILTVSASMKDDPSKKNWKVIKNDTVGLSQNELNKRNVLQNYDSTKEVEEFKENNNIKKRMKKLHKLYEDTVVFNKKMQYLKNFCKVMSEFIDTFDSYKLINDTVFEKYYIYLQGLFESYNIYFSKKKDEQFTRDAINKIVNYFSKISILDTYYIRNLIDKLEGIKELNNEMFEEIVIKVMGILTNKGIETLNSKKKWSKHKAKQIFNDIIIISLKFMNEEELELLEDITLADKWRDYLKKCREYIQVINASTKVNIEEDRDKYNLYEKKDNEDEEHLELVLDNFRDALRDLENDNQKCDLELEAICLANIAKIKYNYLNHNNKMPILKEIHLLSSESVRRAMSLVNIEHKNVENTNWFKEIKKIDSDINQIFLLEEEKREGGFKLNVKNENKEIFDELEKVFKKSNFEVVKFILNKYPPLDYQNDPNKTIESQWEDNKKGLINKLCTKYAPDNYPKETNEEKLKYTIISEISTKINSIYNEIK